ncbi:hypothetical protein AX16_004077 [Volvariella volvacea WC 439]|nr:hypothetical protein AX16_004077 [Volvariella volvacea WC 439]
MSPKESDRKQDREPDRESDRESYSSSDSESDAGRDYEAENELGLSEFGASALGTHAGVAEYEALLGRNPDEELSTDKAGNAHSHHDHARASQEQEDRASPVAAGDVRSQEHPRGIQSHHGERRVGEAQGGGEEYPEQRHAGKVGFGPQHNQHNHADLHDIIGGMKDVVKGKLTHHPELVHEGHERMEGHLHGHEKHVPDEGGPFKLAEERAGGANTPHKPTDTA